VKAAVELAPSWGLLKIKLALLAQRADAAGRSLPTWLVVSAESKGPVEEIADDFRDSGLDVCLVEQSLLPRLRPDGEIYTDDAGERSFCPPGLGESLDLAAELCRRPEHRDVGCVFFSNLDNVLASLDPAAVGLQARTGRDLVEVAPARPGDVGGVIVRGGEGAAILEPFRLTRPVTTPGRLLNTNTIWLTRETLLQDHDLPWHKVTKKVSGEPVVQFERLLCEVAPERGFLPVTVDRLGDRGRFAPLKTPEDLERTRSDILASLRRFDLPI
jgi:UTP--glucose-1-phosphate uridylyltransferase